MERGLVPMRDLDIKALCELFKAEQKALTWLLNLARLDRDRRRAKGWWQHPPHAGAMSEFIAMEDVAASVRTWQLSLIPGLLQTAEYARSLAVSDGVWEDPDEIERVVEVRMKRQARLSGEKPLKVHAVVWEAALRQLVGGAGVMRRQLQHLLEAAELPNVQVQIMPFRSGGHPCVGGSFSILSFAESEAVDVVHVDTVTSTVWMENEESIRYRGFFDGAARSSLAPRDSAGLISDIRKGMEA
jgi:hypothetical protein